MFSKTAAIAIGTAAAAGLMGTVLYRSSDMMLVTAKENPADEIYKRLNPFSTWDSNWDKRDPEYRYISRYYRTHGGSKLKPAITDVELKHLQDLRPKAARNILLIRHGHYNRSAPVDADQHLTTVGREQAVATGKRLKTLLRNGALDHYIVSDMTRALETAEIIGAELELGPKPLNSFQCDPLLREGRTISNVPRNQAQNLNYKSVISLEPDPLNHTHLEHEYYQDEMRVEAAFRKYFHRADPKQEEDSYEIIICHANIIRYFCCRLLQFPPGRWLRISVAHGSITQIRIDPDGEVSLFAIGDSGHLPTELVTTRNLRR